MLTIVSISVTGSTSKEQDYQEGLVIDFGYWNVVWTNIVFDDEMNGIELLEIACDVNGYSGPQYMDDGSVFSINDQQSLTGVKWGFYTLKSGEGWRYVEDPSAVNVKDYSSVCWARASGESTVIPGTDASGFLYYNYGMDGVSLKTGEKLRVVTLAPSLTEMVVSVGGVDNIVGTDLYSNYPQSVVDKQDRGEISYVGGYSDPNYEWIIKLGPDIVFCDGGVGEHVNMANKLRKSGISCVVTYDSVDIDTLYNNLWIVASALGYTTHGNHTINQIRTTMDVVAGIVGVQATKRTFFALSSDSSPWTAGSDTFVNDLISRLSGRNIFSSQQSSWFMVAKESIHFNQPEVIIIIYESKEITSDEEYTHVLENLDPLWKETPAYRNGEVYIFSKDSANILIRPGPRLGIAAELLAKVLNPGPFTDKDPLDVIPRYFGNDFETYLNYQRGAFL